jgi:hypothetical protein
MMANVRRRAISRASGLGAGLTALSVTESSWAGSAAVLLSSMDRSMRC